MRVDLCPSQDDPAISGIFSYLTNSGSAKAGKEVKTSGVDMSGYKAMMKNFGGLLAARIEPMPHPTIGPCPPFSCR